MTSTGELELFTEEAPPCLLVIEARPLAAHEAHILEAGGRERLRLCAGPSFRRRTKSPGAAGLMA